MGLTFVATFTGLFALVQILRKKTIQAVFLDVYLFAVFLMPGWCRLMVPSIPKMTFHETAMLPVIGLFFMKYRKNWQWSFADFPVFALVALFATSEYINAGYKEAQNLGFSMIAAGAFPYILGKALIEPMGLRVQFVKRMVWYLVIVTGLFVYEFRFFYNPYRIIFDHFFPNTGWISTGRYGFARAAGPYSHALLAGTIFLIGFRLQRWLEQSGHWEKYFPKFRPFGLTKARIITIVLFLGLAMTLARGPQIGTVMAAVIAFIGAGKNFAKRGLVVVILVLVIGVPMAIQGYQYAAVGRDKAKTVSQESAAYRKELIDKYEDIAIQHSAIGWGRNGWPKVSGMPSIDNYYLLLALMHGVGATTLFLTIQLSMIVRLLRNGFANAPMKPLGSSLSFTLAGIYVGLIFTFFTVYMGENVLPVFFLLTGFAEGYLLAGGDASVRAPNKVTSTSTEFSATAQQRFAVVLT